MVAYLKAIPQVRTYSDYLRATGKAKKEISMELPQGPRTQATNAPSKPRATSFFPMRKLKSNQPISKMPEVHLVHLEEEDARAMKIKRVTTLTELKELQKSLWYAWQGP